MHRTWPSTPVECGRIFVETGQLFGCCRSPPLFGRSKPEVADIVSKPIETTPNPKIQEPRHDPGRYALPRQRQELYYYISALRGARATLRSAVSFMPGTSTGELMSKACVRGYWRRASGAGARHNCVGSSHVTRNLLITCFGMLSPAGPASSEVARKLLRESSPILASVSRTLAQVEQTHNVGQRWPGVGHTWPMLHPSRPPEQLSSQCWTDCGRIRSSPAWQRVSFQNAGRASCRRSSGSSIIFATVSLSRAAGITSRACARVPRRQLAELRHRRLRAPESSKKAAQNFRKPKAEMSKNLVLEIVGK